ncbi:MAG: glycogen synthase GlgA [Betaproteobacteria bacterium]
MRVLYVSTELHPALKTGGLADVNAALPPALARLGVDVRLLLPAFPALLRAVGPRTGGVRLQTPFQHEPVRVVATVLAGVPAWLIEAPALYDRPGDPYVDAGGLDWPDNHLRFALLGWIAARFADGTIDGWRPDIVHGHDWHAGLAPAYLAARGGERPASVFTVHNLSFHGQFPAQAFAALALPTHFFAVNGVEFYGNVNFMKAGLHYADRITTVSPTYAREIQQPEQGCGMDGLLRSRAGALVGILNGIDDREWNPATDARIAAPFGSDRIDGKSACKAALRQELGLAAATGPLFGVVSRLTGQKGLDLLLPALPQLTAAGGQLALLGSGEPALERAFGAAAAKLPGAIAMKTGYDEDLAHRIIAGADVIVVPSRFEPCGLTQMYGLAYGTLPLVRRAGGLADTVSDAATAEGNGFVFDKADAPSLAAALKRVFALWRKPDRWDALRRRAMLIDHGWAVPARAYLDLYRSLRPHA